jgi:hypothetical protein
MDVSMPSKRASDDERLSRGRIAALWFIVLGPLVAAFSQQQLAYGLVDPACARHMPLVVQLPLLLSLAIVAVALLLARKEWTRDDRPARHSNQEGSTRLFPLLGFLSAGLSLALIVAEWLPTLFLNPCQR